MFCHQLLCTKKIANPLWIWTHMVDWIFYGMEGVYGKIDQDKYAKPDLISAWPDLYLPADFNFHPYYLVQ